MKKQIITWILAALCCSLVLGGCGLQRAAVSSAQPIRIFMEQREEAPISSDMAVVRELEKRCNVSIELEVYSKTEAPQKFKSYLASQDGPDIFIYNLEQIHANYTAFVPLTPYIGENTPNLKKYLVDDGETNKELTMLDGQIYALPMIASERVSQWYILRGATGWKNWGFRRRKHWTIFMECWWQCGTATPTATAKKMKFRL